MHLYVELWKARPSWQALDRQARQQYVAGIGAAIEALVQEGIEPVGFTLNDDATPHPAPYHFVAVWRMPTAALVAKLEATVEESGFHDYFEQVNARGELIDAEQALFHMVMAPR